MTCFTRIHHISLATGNMDATIRFWRDLLGLRLVAGQGRPGFRQYFFELARGQLVAFFEWEGAEPLPERDPGSPMTGSCGFDHLALTVADEDELWKLKDRLDAAGIWATEVVDHGYIASLYTFDPNNIPLELGVLRPQVELGRPPRLQDRAPSAVALEGSEPQPGHWPRVSVPTPREERRIHPGAGAELFSGN